MFIQPSVGGKACAVMLLHTNVAFYGTEYKHFWTTTLVAEYEIFSQEISKIQ
jgi:hypothetical protein